MDKKDYDLLEILKLMTEYKATRIKMGGLEVELSPRAFQIDDGKPLTPTTQPIGMEFGNPTDDEMLYYSTPHFPDIRSKEEPVISGGENGN